MESSIESVVFIQSWISFNEDISAYFCWDDLSVGETGLLALLITFVLVICALVSSSTAL